MSKRVHNTRKARKSLSQRTDMDYHPTKRRGGKRGQKVSQGPLQRSLKAVALSKERA